MGHSPDPPQDQPLHAFQSVLSVQTTDMTAHTASSGVSTAVPAHSFHFHTSHRPEMSSRLKLSAWRRSSSNQQTSLRTRCWCQALRQAACQRCPGTASELAAWLPCSRRSWEPSAYDQRSASPVRQNSSCICLEVPVFVLLVIVVASVTTLLQGW